MKSTRHLYPTKTAFEAAFQVVRRAGIPQIPDVVLALRKEMGQLEPDLRVAADLIAQDPALTGQLLKTINSPAFNLSAPITSVSQAVGLLGLGRLTTIVTAEAINRMMGVNQGSVRVLWESIMENARVITAIARVTSGISQDEAYLFGIMHDVGSLIFANVSDNYISEWSFRGNSEPSVLLSYERSTLGVDHTTVGFLLAHNWKLPEPIALAILHHHSVKNLEVDEPTIPYLIALAKLAHYLVALSHGTHDTPEMQDYREQAWQTLDIGEGDWQDLNEQALHGGW
ncbi:HDOD domain-containing protein [Thiocystis violacea]|uniref:HDOD domain-containing protein n=1 Tax=Thiocystis violacea TaxID=13725 RepID=UPI001902E734|nr:HDOD domain-containing protein [Thiocystis violacea]MBK1719511.1 histidine kinase [Thiocystis violacea]